MNWRTVMKRHRIAVALFLFSCFTLATLTRPAVVHAFVGPICPRSSINVTRSFGAGSGTFTVVFPPGSWLYILSGNPSAIFKGSYPGTITRLYFASGPFTLGLCGGAYFLDSGAGGALGPMFGDGRLNNNDPWETTAVYCQADGSVRVYVLGSPNWTVDFDASPAEIGKVPKNPAHNTLIEKG